jgi:undecaprenyl-diphosphatase
MDWLQAVIIAIVEGLTEFLPVSSTGHMIIAQGLLGIHSDDFVKAFTVIIQFGAILSVLVLYWRRFLQSWDFYVKLLIAFLPAAVIGLLAGDWIDRLLESVPVVAVMLIVGGVFMLFVDRWFSYSRKNEPPMSNASALKIGLAQCIAMIPGVSRSMATIVGGMAQKFSRRTAAEFSFFLAVPTMAAASGYKMLKLLLNDTSRDLLIYNFDLLIIGNIVAFAVAIMAIRFFIEFLTKYGFRAFGWYRIIAGGVILALLLAGYPLEVA